MAELRKYNVETRVYFPLVDFGSTDFEAGVTIAAGDATISKDGGAFVNIVGESADDLFVDEGGGLYSIKVAAAELQAKTVVLRIVDQTGTKEWEDQMVLIDTYGNGSAQHAFDLGTASVAQSADNDTRLATIETDTNEIQGKLPTNKFMGSSDGADDDGTLNTIATDAARLTAVRAAVLTDWINDGRLDVLLDAIKVVTDAQAKASTTIITGTIDTTVAATTTEFEADDITEATADHFNGRVILFTTNGVDNRLVGQATDITDYALNGGRGHFTVTALTEAPINNSTFVII